jgi:tRNA pseudouridine55 synthase
LVRLGTTTTTDDAEGEIVAVQSVPVLNEEALRAALIPFQGDILQIPPMYSALHHQGKRLYDLARAGETVERAPRPVTISQLDLLEYRPPDLITLTIACSKGTYIRSLARDLGAALGCGAHLAALERTFVGAFTLDAATPLAALEADATVLPGLLLPPELAVIAWPAIALSETQAALLRHGRPLHLPPGSGDHVRAHAPGGALLALLQRDDELWHPHKVFL